MNNKKWTALFILLLCALRVSLAFVVDRFMTFPIIPDEIQYDIAARAANSGQGATFWGPYGVKFLEVMSAYMEPLKLAYRVHSDPISGRLLSVIFSLMGSLFVLSALRLVVNERISRVSVIVYSFIPTTTLWSITLVREALLHMSIAGMVYAALWFWKTDVRTTAQFASRLLLFVGTSFVIGFSRSQTLVPIAAAVVALLFLSLVVKHRNGLRALLLVFVGLIPATLASGIGFLGVDLLRSSSQRLGQIQVTMSLNSDSALVDGASEPNSVLVDGASGPSSLVEERTRGVGAVEVSELPKTEGFMYRGVFYGFDNSLRTQVSHFPSKFLGAALRPLFFEHGSGLEFRLAGFETLAWSICLFILISGLLLRDRLGHLFAVLVACLIVVGVFLGSFALTQGNMGTLFRHRTQLYPIVLPGLAVVFQSYFGFGIGRQSKVKASKSTYET